MISGKLYIVLGCFGRIDDGFVSCASCENKILLVDEHLDNYNQMMDYFDSCRLFDRPMFEYSAIAHFIKNMQDRFDQIAVGKRLWSEKRYHLYQKFIAEHRMCGLYIRLVLVNENEEETTKLEEKGIFIPSQKTEHFEPKTKLKLVRGR